MLVYEKSLRNASTLIKKMTPFEIIWSKQCPTEEFELKPFAKLGHFKRSSMKLRSTKKLITKRPKWKRRFLKKKKKLNALGNSKIQNHVVDVGVHTRKNAWHWALSAPYVESETTTQVSAKVNCTAQILSEGKALFNNTTNFAIRKICKQDAITEDKQDTEDPAIAMGKSAKCCETKKSTGSQIPATRQAMSVSSTICRFIKRAKASRRPVQSW